MGDRKMAIKNQLIDLSLTVKGSRIMLGGQEVGLLRHSYDLGLNKKEFLGMWNQDRILAKLFAPVPDNYKFNYYFLDEIRVYGALKGYGVGTRAMEYWFSKLKAPAVVCLELASYEDTSTNPKLRKFYKRLNFQLFRHDGLPYAVTFVKAK